ncbi:MAG: adenylyl-sulfate kinase [Acidiferrobacteraceae bacterium]
MIGPLRFVTCGSIGDGKSTLISRVFSKSKQILDDLSPARERDSALCGAQGETIEWTFFMDGPQAEQKRGTAGDVACLCFATARRKFVVADTSGDEQCTHNMATEASMADLAVLLVDARKGLLVQTCLHSRIAAMFGVRHVVLAVNKMDLVGWDADVFFKITSEYKLLADELQFASVQGIPVSALVGGNLTKTSLETPWYGGPTLLDYLENIDVSDGQSALSFRMPVQGVNQFGQGPRGYSGRIASGTVRKGDRVRIMPGMVETRVRSIVVGQAETSEALSGDPVTLCMEDDVEMSRGDVISSDLDPAELSDQFGAKVVCLSGHRLVPGRPYVLKLHATQVDATITTIKHRIDMNNGTHLAARTLELNDIGLVNLSTARLVVFEPFYRCKNMGAFTLVDRLTNEMVGIGTIDFALRRASNLHWQSLDVDKAARAGLKHQKPACLWLTGLSGSGKSTIANLLEKRLFAAGHHTYILDGDNIRHGLNRDLGFTEVDRVENIRRVAEVARLMVDAGLMVIVSFLSPFRSERDFARSLFSAGELVEIFVDAPFEECERRDTKGLYAKARRGELKNFTGIDSPYEPPESPEVRLDTLNDSPEDCVSRVLVAIGYGVAINE